MKLLISSYSVILQNYGISIEIRLKITETVKNVSRETLIIFLKANDWTLGVQSFALYIAVLKVKKPPERFLFGMENCIDGFEEKGPSSALTQQPFLKIYS